MSTYAVNRPCRHIVHEPELRRALEYTPEQSLHQIEPALSEQEVELLLTGDAGGRSKLGANDFLLHQLGRGAARGFGVTRSVGQVAFRCERRPTGTLAP